MGVEQWRAAVGVMANSVAAKPQSPIGPHWKKWLKTSDPVVYKGCVVFLVVVAQLVWSGLRKVVVSGRVNQISGERIGWEQGPVRYMAWILCGPDGLTHIRLA